MTTPPPITKRIEGLVPRTSIAAAIAVGRKGPTGNPIENDRFYIVWPQEDDTGRRPPHPQYERFNNAKPEYRRSLSGVLVHSRRDDCFESYLRAQAPKGERSPPSRRPFCWGNGTEAERFTGIGRDGREEYKRIPCPGRACPFQQTTPAGCKAHSRLLFMLRWPDQSMPAALVKLETNSWHSASSMLGFFEEADRLAQMYGLPAANLAGLPFTLILSQKKSAAKKSRFPVLSLVPAMDLQAFLLRQADIAERLLSTMPAPLALTDAELQDPKVAAADYEANEVYEDDDDPASTPGTDPTAEVLALLARVGLTPTQLDAYLVSKGRPPLAGMDPGRLPALVQHIEAAPVQDAIRAVEVTRG